MFQEPILKDLVDCSQSREVGIFTIPLLHVKAQIQRNKPRTGVPAEHLTSRQHFQPQSTFPPRTPQSFSSRSSNGGKA